MSKLSRLALGFDKEQVMLGDKIEKEHNSTIEQLKANPKTTLPEARKKILTDHLKENDKYYHKTPGVEDEALLIPAANKLVDIRRAILSKDRLGGIASRKLAIAAVSAKMVRGQEDPNAYTSFFSQPGFGQATYNIQRSLAQNVKEIVDGAIASNTNDWNFLTVLLKGNQQMAMKLRYLAARASVLPMDFLNMMKSNNYSFPEAMVDLETKLRQVDKAQQEKSQKFKGTAKNKSPYKKEAK